MATEKLTKLKWQVIEFDLRMWDYKDYLSDGLHLNKQGMQLMASSFRNYVSQRK